jgi:undecaprenyl-diphosphatase
MDGRLAHVDHTLFLWMLTHRQPFLNVVAITITRLGHPLTLTIVILLAVAWLLYRHHWLEAWLVALASSGISPITTLLKLWYHRPRPHMIPWLLESSGHSFPSGHATGAMVCYGVLAFVAIRFRRHLVYWPGVVASIVCLVASIALSRVYLGVHFATDVVGGVLVGGGWLALVLMGGLLVDRKADACDT